MSLVKYHVGKIIENTPENMCIVQNYCSNRCQHRIYSNWHRIPHLFSLLRTLGFNAAIYYESPNSQEQVEIQHWYGYESDLNEVQQLLKKLGA